MREYPYCIYGDSDVKGHLRPSPGPGLQSNEMIRGFAAPEPSYRFAKCHPETRQFYRKTQSVTISSLGLGSYLGAMDDATDSGYEEAVKAAIDVGINCIDTSLNYRNQRSERAIGRALAGLFEKGGVEREQIFVSTKAGYLVPGAVPETDEIEGGVKIAVRWTMEGHHTGFGVP